MTANIFNYQFSVDYKDAIIQITSFFCNADVLQNLLSRWWLVRCQSCQHGQEFSCFLIDFILRGFLGCILMNNTIHETIMTIGEAIEFCSSLNSRLVEIYNEEQKEELISITSDKILRVHILIIFSTMQLRKGSMATGQEDMNLLMRTYGFGMNHLNLLKTLFGTQVT